MGQRNGRQEMEEYTMICPYCGSRRIEIDDSNPEFIDYRCDDCETWFE